MAQVWEYIKIALMNIKSNKGRSILTMLGIIIGVAAVIILVSIVNGYMGSMVENFTSMGVNRITVNVTNLASRSLDVDDMYAFYEENSALFAQMSPTVNVSTSVKNGTDEMDSTTVAGYGEEYLELMSYELEAGRNLSYADIMSRQKVCIIGAYVAQELYGSTASALNQTIKIGGSSFKVVGIVEAQDERHRRFCVAALQCGGENVQKCRDQQLYLCLQGYGPDRGLHPGHQGFSL